MSETSGKGGDGMGTETTAQEYRAQAAAHRQEARDSFERCDTDGFLSQWASGINARLADAKADIAAAGGTAMFARYVLCSAETGARMDARVVSTRYGLKWRIDETDEWITYGSERAAKRRGYEMGEEIERAGATAIIDSNGGRGLSGATSCFIRTYRTDAKKTDGWRFIGFETDERSDS